ncbi:beta-galactosidase [Aequitasia blattaphilus]|uniref:Beta-galactosidase n=1 Tax=Aequitasia blattaphilus TaxID=2949332 RepID=A0ABT1EBH3_9FIRM|nr:beta-galactosidase [Aequitasia blattaphilus]MCP1102984.1 beta-galactosidase [Aequitasia blattaphilus]MCR8615624.1 beta-galactosidase [Aequitasia blattaphilus]
MNIDKITMGVCYYPEHWDKSLWKEDLLRMQENGIEVVRIAEFAWTIFEPKEGNFNFDFFDSFLEVAKEVNMKVIMGTPTATPPVWLTEKYPEVLNSTKEGVLYRHGCRRHYNYNSKIYQELSSRIVEKMSARYGNHECIIGWQIDNELNCELNEFYSESDTKAFRSFLKDKYESLDALNQAWGTVFWNQTYSDWEEIFVPRKVVSDSTNPHQVLDYTRFISDSACRFAKMQSNILRKNIGENIFVTTNGMFGNLDNHRMTKESLDVYMYDSYPNFAFAMEEDPKSSRNLNDRKWSRNLSEVRSISPIFGIMEQQSGANGWNSRMEAPAPKPGQLTLWTMQSIAHGADFISYFRWRTCTKGTEIYWHGILDYSNRDNRRLQEVNEVSKIFESIKELAGAEYKASFGVIKDYDNIWDAQLDEWHKRIEKVSQKGIFQGAQLTHTPMDYVYLNKNTDLEQLKKYPVLFYPHPTIITEDRAQLLKDYVYEGGKLVVGCRSGYKDITGQCVMEKAPGLLRNMTGTDVVDYTFVGPGDEESYVDWKGTQVKASVFNDILEPIEESRSLGTYVNNYYKGKSGLIEKEYGKGKTYYFGGTFSRETTEVFLDKLDISTPYKDIIELPQMCELGVREKNGIKYIFVLNFDNAEQEIYIKSELYNMYTKKAEIGKIKLTAFETKVYKIKR